MTFLFGFLIVKLLVFMLLIAQLKLILLYDFNNIAVQQMYDFSRF